MYDKLRSLCIVLAFLGSASTCLAQHSIKGRVIDEFDEPLVYATVVLLSPADSTVQYYDISDEEGLYQIENIKPAHYLLQYSLVAKEVIYKDVVVPSDMGEDLGDIIMKTVVLDEMTVTAEYMVTPNK